MRQSFHWPVKRLTGRFESQTQRQLKRQSVGYQSPNTESEPLLFDGRNRQSSIVVGQFLWIHGGNVITWNGSGSGVSGDPAGNITTLPNNYTYSIDLSSTWTNEMVALNAIDSEAPALVMQALWEDPGGSSFYAYDGGVSYSLQLWQEPAPPVNQLWKFTPSGRSGKWSQVGALPSSNFPTLKRSQNGYYAFGGGLGFALGGYQNRGTGVSTDVDIDTPGMVIYNFTSMEWSNVSATGYSFDGVAAAGAGHFVPGFGQAGLLFILAGQVGSGSSTYMPGLDSVFMFDPSSQQWSSQQTSGTVPMPVTNPCVVGVHGDNNTYEIFFYGGVASDPNQTVVQGGQGAVYILTLPAFHWLRTKETPIYRRSFHSCNVVGNRQMVAVGGEVSKAVGANVMIPDPWRQGLDIFDMSAMVWKDKYDPKAEAYVSPDPVKAYYQQNGTYPKSWSNDIVKSWFTEAAANNTTSAPATPGPSPALPTGSPETRTGTLAGGISGGVAALALIALFVLYLLWRRRRRQRAAAARLTDSGKGYQKPELEDNRKEPPSELHGVHIVPEMEQREVATSELPFWQEMHELPVERPELSGDPKT